MNLRDYLTGASARVSWETYNPPDDARGRLTFAVELAFCSKQQMEEINRTCTKRTWEKLPNGQRQWKEELDEKKLRTFLAGCISNWRDLTFGKVAELGNFVTPNGDRQSWGDKAVPCDEENKLTVLETVLGFEGWCMQRITSLAEAQEREEAREVLTSGPTRADSSTT